MNELLNLDIIPESFDFSVKADERQIAAYQSQIAAATVEIWGRYWPKRISDAVKNSGLFSHIALSAAKAVKILGMEKSPELGLLNGFRVGKLNYLGYCWEDNGQVWVGFDENWFGNVGEEIAGSGGNLSPLLYKQLSFVIAEEVFHAYVREKKPDLAEENIQANASEDPEAYRNSRIEIAAKKFAGLFVMQDNS